MSDLTPEEQAIADQAAADQAAADEAAANAAAPAVKPAEKKPVAKKATQKAEASSDYPTFMHSTTQFPYVDPDTGIRFSPNSPVKVEVEPQEGSWLHSQIAAGLIGKA